MRLPESSEPRSRVQESSVLLAVAPSQQERKRAVLGGNPLTGAIGEVKVEVTVAPSQVGNRVDVVFEHQRPRGTARPAVGYRQRRRERRSR